MTVSTVYPIIQTLPRGEKVKLLERLTKELENTNDKSLKAMSEDQLERQAIRNRLKAKLYAPK